MRLVDRHIAARFLWNFLVLFAVLFVFAVSIDVILQLDRFLDAADAAVRAGAYRTRTWALLTAIFNFHGPRIFQFYAYLLGLVVVAAMGFTLAQMHRHRELVALLAAGQSLHRIALPMVVTALLLNGLQLVNTELVIPRLAPLLMREHGDILQPGINRYPIPLSPDGRDHLLLARSFDPRTATMEGVLALRRDARGAATHRIVADKATWDEATRTWILTGGQMTLRQGTGPPGGPGAGQADGAASGMPASDAAIEIQPIDRLEVNLDPQVLAIRHSAQYAQMLSLAQLAAVERAGGADPGVIGRARWSRLAGVVVNMLVLLVAMPSFLLREPANLLRQSVHCAAITIPAMLGALAGATVSIPGVPPAVAVFLPAVILAPIAAARITGVRT